VWVSIERDIDLALINETVKQIIHRAYEVDYSYLVYTENPKTNIYFILQGCLCYNISKKLKQKLNI